MSTITGLVKRSDIIIFYLLNNRLHCHWLDQLMKKITLLGDIPFGVAVPTYLFLSSREDWRKVALQLAINLIVSQSIVQSVKRLVNRPRPYCKLENVNMLAMVPCQYSFPSGHTCAAFILALTIMTLHPFVKIISLGLATLVGISRIYLGVHYPSDVIIGSLIALVTTFITTWIF
ncbi:phosphatase PAP2 family protein [Alkaliphilus crotonatoxidans]